MFWSFVYNYFACCCVSETLDGTLYIGVDVELFVRHRCFSYAKQSAWYKDVSERQCNGRHVLHQPSLQIWSNLDDCVFPLYLYFVYFSGSFLSV